MGGIIAMIIYLIAIGLVIFGIISIAKSGEDMFPGSYVDKDDPGPINYSAGVGVFLICLGGVLFMLISG